MANLETVQATSGNGTGTFVLDWDALRWQSATSFEEGAFPFVAEVRGKRYELYSDGGFDEEENA
ncbi:MAG: hypothetical protein ACLPYS_09110 [Vulcanimicrobiaceae bacterium]